ncbi:hypothetical protein PIB30_009152 [Stylosanthes scabra]|uniref:Uncharacterized protein n=1 Tax=Stylosanthes scabra TaxID=79078 RepID=A0ABU6X5V7_9FABA|nr:hypothetical protein [Stylosanthes scabra]
MGVQLDGAVNEAFDVAYIYAFHAAQKTPERIAENMKGVQCKRVARFINSVGLYVPGGTAVLPSTALMFSVDGTICIMQGYSSDGLGTETRPKVEKIFGSGNQYVTAAKMILQENEVMVAIDMPAGPSESDSQVVLVIAGKGVNVNATEEELKNQCQSLRRGEFSVEAHSFIVYARDVLESINFSNLYAPEHLIVNAEDAEKWEGFIENAGGTAALPSTALMLSVEVLYCTKKDGVTHILKAGGAHV